jgi:hypothetical protein
VGDEDVVGLDVAVDESLLVQVGHSACDFEEHFAYLVDPADLRGNALVDLGLGCALLRHAPQQFRPQLLPQGLALHELHDQVEVLAVVGAGEALHQVRVRAQLLDLVLLDELSEAGQRGALEAVEEGRRLVVAQEDGGLLGLADLLKEGELDRPAAVGGWQSELDCDAQQVELLRKEGMLLLPLLQTQEHLAPVEGERLVLLLPRLLPLPLLLPGLVLGQRLLDALVS